MSNLLLNIFYIKFWNYIISLYYLNCHIIMILKLKYFFIMVSLFNTFLYDKFIRTFSADIN